MVVQRDGFPVGYIKEDSQSGYRVLGLILGEVFLTVGFWVFPEGFEIKSAWAKNLKMPYRYSRKSPIK